MLVVDRDIACHNAGGQPNRLEIWSLSENAHRLTLNLPSHAHSYHAHIFDNPGPYISDETNPQLGLYVHDSAADRIVVLSIVYDQFSDDHRIGSMLVISVSEILNILASPHLRGRLNWSTWAPRATRWFKYPDSEDIIIYKAMVFIANQKVDDLSFGTSAILSHYTDEDSSIVLDFNRRSIRRDKQESLRVDDRNAAHHSAPPKLSTGAPPNTTMHIIEEEWKIDAFLCLKDVQSCLPFRIIIGEPVASSVRRNYFVVSDVSVVNLRHIPQEVHLNIYILQYQRKTTDILFSYVESFLWALSIISYLLFHSYRVLFLSSLGVYESTFYA